MEKVRTRFQGVYNILRFNWHFYVIALAVLIALMVIALYFPSTGALQTSTYVLCGLLVLSSFVSLLVSYYVYDASGLYELRWLDEWLTGDEKEVVNIHAGFDETSELIRVKLSLQKIQAFDFYDPRQHTEVSIKRARKAYPLFPGTKKITTGQLPLENGSVELVLLVLAAHEIRNGQERITFFRELHRSLVPGGRIVVVEHLRDLPNFIAYTIGFFHFLTHSTWLRTFSGAGLRIRAQRKINPFIHLFILEKNDPAS